MIQPTATLLIAQIEPVIIAPSDSVAEACRAMRHNRASAVLIVGAGDRLLGIFTCRDAARCMAQGCDPQQTRVEWEMTRDPITAPPGLPAQEALRILEEAGVHHLPICAEGRLRGVLRRQDGAAAG